MGKRTALKDAIKDITSDSQVNSYFPYRWSPASLTLNIYFYLYLYLYIARITINKGTPHLKSPKNQNRRAALERPAVKLLGGFNKFAVDQSSPLILLWFIRQQLQQKHHTTKQEQTTQSNKNTQHLFFLFSEFIYHKARQRTKLAAMHVATMLADNKK